MNVSVLLFGLSCALLAAPSAQAFPYVDLIDYPQQEDNWDRFFALEGRLQHGFDNICGDTFCEGEYSDIRALRLRCSVDAVRGTVHECLWAFVASDLEVSREDGAIVARQPTWLCRLPLVPGTPVEAFHAALAARDPLHDPLPGTSQSVYDGLTDCL